MYDDGIWHLFTISPAIFPSINGSSLTDWWIILDSRKFYLSIGDKLT